MNQTTTIHVDADPVEAYRFDGVLRRRVFAFVIDYALVIATIVVAAIVVGVVGVLTLGLGWLLYAILGPLVILPYIWLTLGGPDQATPGMKMMGIKLVRDDDQPVDGMLAIVHCVLFWAFNSALSPLVLLVTLFTNRKRTLHDVLLGTAVVRAAA